MDKDYLLRKQQYVDRLRKDLSENYWDYKLKFSQESFDVDGYLRILSQMFYLLQQFNESMAKDEISIAQGCQQFTCEQGKEEGTYAFIIASRFKTMDLREMIVGGLMNFVDQKKSLASCDDLVSEIKMKCQIV